MATNPNSRHSSIRMPTSRPDSQTSPSRPLLVIRREILSWINQTLDLGLTNFDEVCSGVIPCRIMDVVYPGVVPMDDIKSYPKTDHEKIQNFKVLQDVFDRLGIKKRVEFYKLVNGNRLMQDNLDFMQWLKEHCDSVSGGGRQKTTARPSSGRTPESQPSSSKKPHYSNVSISKTPKCTMPTNRSSPSKTPKCTMPTNIGRSSLIRTPVSQSSSIRNSVSRPDSQPSSSKTAQVSRSKILSWINQTLNLGFPDFDEVCSGVIPCQIMDVVYPGEVPMDDIKFHPKTDRDKIQNFKVLQDVFDRLDIKKDVEVDMLVNGNQKLHDNLKFMQWLKHHCDSVSGGGRQKTTARPSSSRTPGSQPSSSKKPLVVRSEDGTKKLTLVEGPIKLKFYQVDGIEWLWRLHCSGNGCILGDDMGVGKTLQICVFISSLYNCGLTHRVLIVVPPSTLKNWCETFKELAMPVHLYHGDDKQKELKLVLEDTGILVTTYDTLVHNVDSLTRMWNYLILDEGHTIKSLKTKRSVYLRRIPADHRILMTGTPIQNAVDEIWSLLNFCLPQKFSDLKEFQETCSKPIEIGKNKHVKDHRGCEYLYASEKLKTIIEPYFLRRTKAEVLDDDLPRKLEFTIWLRPTTCQRYLYKNFVNLAKIAISKAPFTAMEVLKKICDDPILFQMGEQEQAKKKNELGVDKDEGASKRVLFQMDAIVKRCQAKNHTFDSCKLLFLRYIVPIMCEEGHSILIFSRRKHTLSIIEEMLKPLKCGRLDGDLSLKNKMKTMEDFQSGAFPILLIMSQVGGMGITLHRANRVVIVDPSWNPSIDDQSVCRAYRLGQNRDVLIYRLITSGTIEEYIYKKQIYKTSLAKVVLETENPFSYFTEEDRKAIFSVSDYGFDTSATQTKLAKEHKVSDAFVQNHIDFLDQLPRTAGITYHSQLFSKVDAPEESKDLNLFNPKDIKTHRQACQTNFGQQRQEKNRRYLIERG